MTSCSSSTSPGTPGSVSSSGKRPLRDIPLFIKKEEMTALDINMLLGLQDFRNDPGGFLAEF